MAWNYKCPCGRFSPSPGRCPECGKEFKRLPPVCPVMSASGNTQYCEHEDCAWWQHADDRCSILSLKVSLEVLSLKP